MTTWQETVYKYEKGEKSEKAINLCFYNRCFFLA